MKEVKNSGGKMVQGMFGALLVTVGVAIASYTQVIPEPAKLLLLGIVLVGGALWTRRQIKGVGDRKGVGYRGWENSVEC